MIKLTPGRPDICKGNGETEDERGELIECCCDECNHYLLCFPDTINTKGAYHNGNEEDL